MSIRNLGLAFRLARREARGSLAGFAVFLACLALGVGAMAWVLTLSASVEAGLARDARALLGGDLEIRRRYRPLPAPVLARLERAGRVSQVIRLRAMAQGPDEQPRLVEVKAVDPAYPLVGRAEMAGGGELAQALAPRGGAPGAAAAPELALRLGLKPGQEFLLGGRTFRLGGILAKEPDRAGDFYDLGPRVLVTRQSLAGTEMLAPGALATYRYRLVLPPGPVAARLADLARLQEDLSRQYPKADWRVRDFRDRHTPLGRTLDNLTLYLTLAGLASLLVGGVGVAAAVRNHLAGRLEDLAVLKCLGAERSLAAGAQLILCLGLALAGGLLGLGAGVLLAWASLGLLAGLVTLELGLILPPAGLALCLAAGLLTALAFTLPPLSSAAAVSPARLFRGYGDPRPRRPGLLALACSALALAALAGLILAATGNPRITLGFLGLAGLAAGVLWAAAQGLIWLARRLPRPRDPRWRHALTSLHRPGSSAARVMVSLGLGLTALVTVALVDGNLQNQINRRLPDSAPSYFFLNLRPADLPAFRKLAASLPGVTRVEAEPTLRGRITRVAGRPASEVQPDPQVAWALRGDEGLSFQTAPPARPLAAGSWWPPDYHGPPLVSFDAKVARGLGVGVGDTLTFNILGREITAKIASLRDIDWESLALNHLAIFDPAVLAHAPYSYVATAYAVPNAEAPLAVAVTKAFPQVAAIYVRDVLGQVARLLSRVGLAIRLMALATLVAGLLVLGETVRAGLTERRHQAVVFKVLGASRRDVVWSLGAEFLGQGLLAALLAAGLGALVSRWFVNRLLEGAWAFLPWPVLLVTAGGAAAALILGLAGVRRALRARAWPVLRNE
ncbi:MAG: ABC transporter permease [Deltaproteobacteria bacterium]|nr:ABC transporter permease [Deltaproteobacteria bacterium]